MNITFACMSLVVTSQTVSNTCLLQSVYCFLCEGYHEIEFTIFKECDIRSGCKQIFKCWNLLSYMKLWPMPGIRIGKAMFKSILLVPINWLNAAQSLKGETGESTGNCTVLSEYWGSCITMITETWFDSKTFFFWGGFDCFLAYQNKPLIICELSFYLWPWKGALATLFVVIHRCHEWLAARETPTHSLEKWFKKQNELFLNWVFLIFTGVGFLEMAHETLNFDI